MKSFVILIATLTVLSRLAFAGVGTADIYFTTPGWTLYLSSIHGSSAYLTFKDGSRELVAQLRFEQFDGYWNAIQSLRPVSSKSVKGSKRQCYLVASFANGKDMRRYYYDFAAVESLLALLLYEHRGRIYADDPEAFRKAFTESPPLPVVHDWKQHASWSETFVIHDRTKDPIR